MQLSGFIAVFVGMILSRLFHQRGFNLLSDEDKLRLINASTSPLRAFAIIPFAAIVGIFWYLRTRTDIPTFQLLIGYFAVLTTYFLVRFIMSQTKFKRLGLPSAYANQVLTGQIAFLAGFGWLFYTMASSVR